MNLSISYRITLCLTLFGLLLQFPMLSAKERTDSLLMQALRQEQLLSYPARDIDLYYDGTTTFNAIFADIDKAQKKVWIEFMIVANDSIGNLTLWHLEQAAKRGVDVRLIIDDYKDKERGYGFRTPHGQDSIRNLGIDLVLFDHFKYPWLNHVCRDHRKLVVVDDSIGFIGGLNIADYYVNGKPDVYGGWRDTHARITGAAVEGIAKLFNEHYQRYGGEKPNDFARYLFDKDRACITENTPQVVYFERSRITPQKQAETRHAIIAALDAAQDTIRLVSPYLMPTHTVRQALIRAIDRGVHVEILFSKVGDNGWLSYGNYSFACRLKKHGAHIFLYRGAFHHSKIMMIDGQVAMVGSANLNSRSLKWDYEASCFIFNADVTARLNRQFEIDKLQCDTFSLDYYHKNYPRRIRMAGWFINRFFTPIF